MTRQSQIDIVQRSNSKHTFYGSGDDEVESDQHCPAIKQYTIVYILPVGSTMMAQSQIDIIVQSSNKKTYVLWGGKELLVHQHYAVIKQDHIRPARAARTTQSQNDIVKESNNITYVL